MAEVYIKDVVNEALAQVGKSCGKTNPYSAELDKVKFYNYPKNGVADSCSIFVDDMVYRHTDPKTASNARAILCEPNVDNCGAGCTQAAGYFKSAKRWISKPSDFKVGDKIFFKKSNGALYHTGLIVDIGSVITTVEGNTNGGKVAKKTYAFTDSKIAGAGRPKYTGYEKPKAETPNNDAVTDPKPIETPVADLKPEPSVTPSKSVDQLAKEVIDGKWGNGKERAERLSKAGYSYQAVQDRVNEMLGIKKPASSSSPAPVPSAPSGQKYIVSISDPKSYLRIRCGAGLNYPEIGKLKKGESVTVYETKNGFGRIGTGKWASMGFLKKA